MLPPTNPYERIRFRSRQGVGVVYEGRRGFSVSSHLVSEAYDCFVNNKKWRGKGKPTKRIGGSRRKRQLIDRDGNECFYCGNEFEPEDLTQEHLVAVVQNGPDRLENLVLACEPCNQEADKMPVIDKVKLRESKRRKHSSLTGD